MFPAWFYILCVLFQILLPPSSMEWTLCENHEYFSKINLFSFFFQPLALVTWGCRLTMSTVQPGIVTNFIRQHALRGPEKISRDGQYDMNLKVPAEVLTDLDDSVLCPRSWLIVMWYRETWFLWSLNPHFLHTIACFIVPTKTTRRTLLYFLGIGVFAFCHIPRLYWTRAYIGLLL